MMPTPERWHLRLLLGLFALYVAELVLQLGVPEIYGWLAWQDLNVGFQLWQLLTRFFVQGPGAVITVLFSLLALYFLLPMMEGIVARRQLGYAVLAGAVVGTVLPLVMNLAGLAHGVAMGWTPLVVSLFVLLGIARPDATIFLYLFPVQARWILWGSLVVALLLLLADRGSLASFQGVGVWLGVYGWWHLLGPGARRRRLSKKAETIERELKNMGSGGKPQSSNLRVIDGGKSKPQGRQGDDWVH
jgi:hypothetical protein